MGLDTIDPLMFSPVSGRDMPELLLRGASPGTIEAAAAVARRLDPRIRTHAESLTLRLDHYLAPARVAAALASTLGLLALSLATVGMFGVFAYSVRQRTREIGLRMALGAQPRQIAGLVFGASSRSVLVGLAVGLLLAAAASRLLQRQLFGLSAFDPPAYCGVCLLLCAAALAATWVPARRAIHIDPLRALRHE
jgi:predicted lysophospholipase L1 biosynthesis ABC-type transport system permease subunit